MEARSRAHSPTRWLHFRSSIQARLGEWKSALAFCAHSVSKFHSVGRLWAAWILLRHLYLGPEAAFPTFLCAIQLLPKAGEIWCEGGRLFLNPSFRRFSPHKAHLCLSFAISLTPQYGDAFFEVRSEVSR